MSRRSTGQLLGYLTSAPELVATAFIATTGLFSVVEINVAGSNIINVFLAGFAALWFAQVRRLAGRTHRIEQGIIAITVVVPVVLILTGTGSAPITALALAAGYVVYLLAVRRMAVPAGPEELSDVLDVVPVAHRFRSAILNIALILVGLVSLYFLGDILGGAVQTLGVSFAVPALALGAVTAVATSLPELTTFFASYREHRRAGTDGNPEVLHNLMASNAANLLLIQTIGIVVFQLFSR